MRGKTSCIILGAGASFAYEDGEARIPLQTNFFHVLKKNGPPYNMILKQNSLRKYLSGKYNREIGELLEFQCTTTLGIEQLYQMVEDDYGKKLISISLYKDLKYELDSITFQGVAFPVATRNQRSRACRHHLKLAKMLEPGDLVVSFNYDCLMDDALFWESRYWFPMTGYGFQFDEFIGGTPRGRKNKPNPSKISIFHPHGSVLFKYTESLNSFFSPLPYLCLLGWKTGIQPIAMKHHSTEVNGQRYPLDTLIVPPSPRKDENRRYLEFIEKILLARLEDVKQYVFIGYSFPLSDLWAKKIFDLSTRRGRLHVEVVNKDNVQKDFRERYRETLGYEDVDFKIRSFEEFVKK